MLGLELAGQGLPGDAALVSLDARLGLSRPFEIDIVFATADGSFSVDDVLFTHVAIAGDQDGAPFYLDGIVHAAGFHALHPECMLFSLSLRPGVEALRHRSGCRIFLDQSRVDVVKAILKGAGLDEGVTYKLRESYEPREMIVQYRESELAFVSRLLEDEGIFYMFRFDDQGHHLVLGDHADAFEAGDDGPLALGAWSEAKQARFSYQRLRRTLSLRPSSVHLRDFDVKRPAQFPEAVAPEKSPVPLPHFATRGGFETAAAGKRMASARLASLRADADSVRLETKSLAPRPGMPLVVESAHIEALAGELVPVEVRLTATQAHAAVADMKNDSLARVTAIPKGARFAPPRDTPRPKIRGYQAAIVTGPKGDSESIHTDSLGRIKIRFPWDRAGKNDETSSAWVRVSQMMLGGAMILPRIGWEVAVGFLGGDPDRPLVVGRLYTAEEMPPYALPGESASTAFRTRSSPGGAGANEIKLGDTSGSQGFAVRAQKDMNTGIGNDKKETIAGNDTTSIGGNASIAIGADESLTVSGSQKVSIGDALRSKIGGSQTIAIGGSDTVGNTANLNESVGGARSYSVGGSSTTISNGIRQEFTGASELKVRSVQLVLAGGTVSDTMLSTFDESAGAAIVQITGGSNVESSASKKQTVKAALGLVCTNWTTSADSVKVLIGGVHVRKVGGDITLSGDKVVIGGGTGTLSGGGVSIKLGGGPVTLSGDLKIDAAGIGILASDLKIG